MMDDDMVFELDHCTQCAGSHAVSATNLDRLARAAILRHIPPPLQINAHLVPDGVDLTGPLTARQVVEVLTVACRSLGLG